MIGEDSGASIWPEFLELDHQLFQKWLPEEPLISLPASGICLRIYQIHNSFHHKTQGHVPHSGSSRNAQTAWNGVPASRGKGHPDWTARHTQRGTRGAGRGKRERHNTRYRPEPPEPAASAAHTRTGHCTRQGSSGALRQAPTPRLGSLRASPRGSHWQQATCTGPAVPAPRATTH